MFSFKFTNRMTNSVDPDQMPSSEAIWSGSTLFAKVGVVVNSRIRVKSTPHFLNYKRTREPTPVWKNCLLFKTGSKIYICIHSPEIISTIDFHHLQAKSLYCAVRSACVLACVCAWACVCKKHLTTWVCKDESMVFIMSFITNADLFSFLPKTRFAISIKSYFLSSTMKWFIQIRKPISGQSNKQKANKERKRKHFLWNGI